MKNLHVQIDDQTYAKLQSLMVYRGQLSRLVRIALRKVIQMAESEKDEYEKWVREMSVKEESKE